MKVVCNECWWVGDTNEVLHGKSPFEDAQVDGCPKCKDINTITACCEAEGCKEIGTCGGQFNGEYKFMCGKHFRM